MLAILTDIHANREALEACLAHAKRHGAERYAFLGDFVGYGADPSWVIDTLQAFAAQGAILVMGNHDQAVFQATRDNMHPNAAKVVEWTKAQLTPEQTAFLQALPLTHEEDDILFVHANAWQPSGWGYIDGCMEAGRSLRATRCALTFCGHMHQPMLYHAAINGQVAAFQPVAGTSIRLSNRRRWLCIPGAVGQPRDGNPAACYALYDPLEMVLTTHRVAYDHATAAQKILAAGLPAFLADRLSRGD
ncbi:metallophosphoesterase family protein [Parvibium lacunae]|uniref:Metallophosphoesterase n=1 Tax=Parvibium lacunae TaxID=1888893 RepID=A0A368L3W7_9BURK|nr:metallophosphoesterase family protein [Parvibium lacunae]RCS58259.1 metallophosphoesterase [Parvibium lacunae]